MKIEEIFNLCLGLGGLVILVIMMLGQVFGGVNERECRSLGYPNAHVNWGGFGQAYCVARQDQSDVIRPIELARKNPR